MEEKAQQLEFTGWGCGEEKSMGCGKAVGRSPGGSCCRQPCFGCRGLKGDWENYRRSQKWGQGRWNVWIRLDFMFLTVRSYEDVYRTGREWRQKVLGFKDNPRSTLWTLGSVGQR